MSHDSASAVGSTTLSARRGVALLSGGLDSVVATTAACRGRGLPGVSLALTFDYGQRSAERELAAARAVAEELGLEWKAVGLPWLAELLPPALARDVNRDMQDSQDARRSPSWISCPSLSNAVAGRQAVWVPNRNGVFLNIAASFAEKLGAGSVVVGFNREEAEMFPDNSREFMERATAALEISTLSHVRVISPTAGLTKLEIVKLGIDIGAPLVHVWSCYEGHEKMCGRCESCVRLLRALRASGTSREDWPRALGEIAGTG